MSLEIRFQADDFFNAYRVLSESNDAMFAQMQKTGKKPQLGTKASKAFGTHPTMTPSVVNLAFAVELYIKDVYYALSIKDKFPRGRDGHNILELFRKLPEETRQKIRNYPSIQKLVAFYSMQTPLYVPQDKSKKPITDILEQQIYKISDAFQKWRYSYEKGTLNYEESTALALIEAAKSAADNARKRSAA